jgi:hypothetical protein
VALVGLAFVVVHTLVLTELNVTALLDPPPVALTVNGPLPKVGVPVTAPNVIVCGAFATVKVWSTVVAGL